MRALLVALLLLAPLASASVPQGDLVVTLREGARVDAPVLSVVPAFVIEGATAADAARWGRDPRVERVDWARPLERHGAPALPSSAFASLTRADASGLTGAGVTVAVVDSGIDATHPDVAGRVVSNVRLSGGQFSEAVGDADGHGTHVAGIVAGDGSASGGRWRGVAPGARLVGVDISDRFTTTSALLAYDWLYANRGRLGIDIVVNAWGRVPDGEDYDPRDPELRAIDRLVAAGVVVIFSASNHGPQPGTLSVEAQDPRVITVGATDAAGLLASYSSRGPVDDATPWTKPDVVAPGDAVASLRSGQSAPRLDDPDPLYTLYSGTSQAAPHVAGIVAQMLEARPELAPAEVARMLRASAIDVGALGPDDETGWGIVDAGDALRMARGDPARRDHVLIAGGLDRTEDSADLAATARRGLLDLATRPQVVWETPFAVKMGAQRVDVATEVAGAQGVTVELAKGRDLIRGTTLVEPEPGIWTLRVRATLPLGVRASATFDTLLPAEPARALESDGRTRAPAFDPAEDGAAALVGGIRGAAWLPLAMWGASGAVLAFAIMPRRR